MPPDPRSLSLTRVPCTRPLPVTSGSRALTRMAWVAGVTGTWMLLAGTPRSARRVRLMRAAGTTL